MLKINPKKDIKELKRYGFKPRYDVATGEIRGFEKLNESNKLMGLAITKKQPKSLEIFFARAKEEWRVDYCNDWFDVDTLYDLIMADMIIKE